ncbi:hypothetical protein COW36_18005 [bacterium (Candidatus Blackallbacteria) CG17_big_fil_post_rev_8_21_14_2_50_48_46]|uniref:Tetracyclin repressor-like C-terminal domain-containing protein n=1 Tax=bacterium (Candidatus Blackallbacteria) CG17_big_fil_post_rev_8_21_14_2_50_48_46 TaxID=2014261 RepID=A0A2M7G1U3_9BACT|nr:MAG: hypothetical protein COW64_00720 [bacterium (Candidatus Blackallbacteria) CG18_big_fil_WC_8_21_14_2_50_49_26]PIW15310.1 MAG: hypothetical protein COW36_18005 [bacterium (Candidatus Blackallbacteria) CG17_big_fil_post_rev_8_21_14_2_50_48_46]PIW45180.1 MAG: hypothetical protein COW20_21010 [bacterium (Candidatus Blackallbacteria) CG13_big_fil_rev_8_21_14_2_50_49_14]
MAKLQTRQILDDFVSASEQAGALPVSLNSFAQAQGYAPEALKAKFASVLEIEAAIYHFFFEETLRLLAEDAAYAEYGTQERVLAFYYTLFELLSANRDYVLLSLQKGWSPLQNIPKLKPFRQAFLSHFAELLSDLLFLPEPFKNMQAQVLSESAWLQFLSILGFWLYDRSSEKERTDVLIEKTVAADFEVLNHLNWRHTPDLLRFWLEELTPERRKQ